MQTLLRHLINKHFEKSTSQNHVKEKPDRKIIPREVEETILTLTGHEQVDALIRESEGLVCRVAELKTSFYKTLDVFKLACVDAEVIPGENYSKTTLEQCITALKSRIGQDKLIADNCGEGVIQMRIKEDIDIMREFTRALRLFNESFAVICSVILAENEDLRSSIKAYDDKILQMAKEIMERQNTEPDKDPNNLSNSTFSYEEMSAVIEANRVGLSESLVQIEQLYNNATRVKEKVMATLMW